MAGGEKYLFFKGLTRALKVWQCFDLDLIAGESNCIALTSDNLFYQYDLKIKTVLDGRTPVCNHIEGDFFTVEGENLVFSKKQDVSMYALAALLPLLVTQNMVAV